MNRTEEPPVKEPRNPKGAERSHLAERSPIDPVPQPGVARKPPDAAEYELAWLGPGNAPPVNSCASDDHVRPLQPQVFADEPPQGQPERPTPGTAVPSVFPTDGLEISGNRGNIRRRNTDIYHDGMHTVS
jgi:hypothetical protein